MMTIDELRKGIFRRMYRWGIAAGVLCGGIYGTILAPLVGTIVGGFVGAGMGLVLGTLNGLLLSRVTISLYYPLVDFKQYQRVTAVQSTLVSGIGVVIMMAIIVYGWWLQRIDSQTLRALPGCVIIPALIGGASAILANWETTHWYRKNVHNDQSTPV